MDWFSQSQDGAQTGLGFGLCLLLASAVGVVAIRRMAQLDAFTRLIVTDTLDGTERVSSLNDTIRQTRLDEYQHIEAHGDAAKKSVEDAMAGEIARVK